LGFFHGAALPDPSVKALTEYPSVLANMDKNPSWTSSLGDAYMPTSTKSRT
jgi:Protein of unknown function (DUF3300)